MPSVGENEPKTGNFSQCPQACQIRYTCIHHIQTNQYPSLSNAAQNNPCYHFYCEKFKIFCNFPHKLFLIGIYNPLNVKCHKRQTQNCKWKTNKIFSYSCSEWKDKEIKVRASLIIYKYLCSLQVYIKWLKNKTKT